MGVVNALRVFGHTLNLEKYAKNSLMSKNLSEVFLKLRSKCMSKLAPTLNWPCS